MPAGFAAGVKGLLKGCATPACDVAAGAPVGERGVVVVVVEDVTGVLDREEVVVSERAAARERVGVRRERQRVQIMLDVVWCCEVCSMGRC